MSWLPLDVRYGFRTLAASPGYAAVALISLGLATAIGTAAYSEMQGMVWRELPGVPRPSELVAVQAPISYQAYRRFSQLNGLFRSTYAYMAPVPFGVGQSGRTERAWGHLVTPSYFTALGVVPELGRFFGGSAEDARSVVVSDRFWRNHLGGDTAIAGKTLRVNGQLLSVAGVAPPDFFGPSPAVFAADLWVPIAAGGEVAPELSGNATEQADRAMFMMGARLATGIAGPAAELQLDAAARKFEEDFNLPRRDDKTRRIVLIEGGKILPIRKQDRPFFTEFFLIMAGLVILIACSNVANMALAQAAERRKEIAIRLALGATRWRLMRQLLVESMLLAVVAGAIGLAIATALMRGASRERLPFPIPIRFDLEVDWRALLFTLGLTALTGIVFGLAPALAATRGDVNPALKQGGAVDMPRRRRVSLRNALMICQVAGSLMLLIMTGALGLGIQGSMGVTSGFDPRNLHMVALDPVRDGYSGAQAAALLEKLLDRVQRMPQVTAAALTDTLPVAMNGNAWLNYSTDGKSGSARRYLVGKDYMNTAGIPVLEGRGFQRGDETGDETSVIVTEALVNECCQGREAVGRLIEIGSGTAIPPIVIVPGTFDHRQQVAGRQMFRIIGVARDVSEDLAMQKPKPAIYFPLRPADYARPSVRGVTLIIRAVPGVDAMGAILREIAALDGRVTPFDIRSMPEQIEDFMFALRVAVWTYGCIGIFGLVLASAGLAGLTAYTVALRRREIGIRIALGASVRNVLGLVMRQGMVLVAIGTAIGLAGGWAGIRMLSAMSSPVQKTTVTAAADPLLRWGAPLLLASIALLACYLPARATAKIDPAVTLRQE